MIEKVDDLLKINIYLKHLKKPLCFKCTKNTYDKLLRDLSNKENEYIYLGDIIFSRENFLYLILE